MTYTTHGLMSRADLADHHELHDTARDPQCPGHQYPSMLIGTFFCTVAEGCPAREEVEQ